MSYADAVQGWHDFYVTSGAAAATLVGLLFVGLSLHIRVVVAHSDVRGLARVTLTDFFVVLMVALLLLTPASDARATGAWLIVVAVVSFGLVVRPALQGVKIGHARTIGLAMLISRFGLSALGYLGLAATGVLFTRQAVDHALSGLLGVVVLLLVVAVRNTWDLLITVADTH